MSGRIEVVALEAGHDGRVYRSAGERWHVEDKFIKDEKDPRGFKHESGQTWFVPVDRAPEPKAKPKDQRPPGAGPVKGSAVAE